MIFNIMTEFCSVHQNQILEHFQQPQKKTHKHRNMLRDICLWEMTAFWILRNELLKFHEVFLSGSLFFCGWLTKPYFVDMDWNLIYLEEGTMCYLIKGARLLS